MTAVSAQHTAASPRAHSRPGRYLLRFDDVCSTSNWSAWDMVEEVLVDLGVAPIVAVTPDNRSKRLVAGPADPRFWDRVRHWQSLGWTVGLHGYQHLMTSADRGLVGLRARSEWAGVPEDVQGAHADAALAVFVRERVPVRTWVAPGHTFDRTTLDVLGRRGIDTVSDGFGRRPYTEDGMFWVPCQTWEITPRRAGIWTVCLHINNWDRDRVAGLRRVLQRVQHLVTDLESLRTEFADRRQSPLDRVQLPYRRLRARSR